MRVIYDCLINMEKSTSKIYNCVRCRKPISRTVQCCVVCLRDFHPGCADSSSHRIYDSENQLVRCNGPYNTFDLQSSGEGNIGSAIDTNNPGYIDGVSSNNVVVDTDVSNNNNTNDNFMSRMDIILNKLDQIQADNLNVSSIKMMIKQEIEIHIIDIKKSVQQTLQEEIKNLASELKSELKNNLGTFVDMNNDKKSYSEIAKKKSFSVSNVDRIVIKPVGMQDTSQTINELKNKIDIAKLGVNIKKITNQSKGRVLIDVEEESDRIKLMNEIKENIGDTYTIKNVNKKLPKVKIVKLASSVLQLSDDKIVKDLSSQNNWKNIDEVNVVKILKKYTTPSGFGSIILEVSKGIYENVINNGKVKFGWNNYRVYSHVNTLRCFRCWGFDHLATSCNNQIACRLCAENHRDNECNSVVKKCINCVKFRNKYKDLDNDPNHCATDRNCSVYKNLIKKKQQYILSAEK